MESSRLLWERFEKSGKLRDYLDFCKDRRKSTGEEAVKASEQAEAQDEAQSSL